MGTVQLFIFLSIAGELQLLKNSLKFSQIFSVSKYIEERNLNIIQWLVDTIEPLLSFRPTAIFSRLNMLKKPSKRDPQQLGFVEKMLLFLVWKKRLWPSYKTKELCKKSVFSITML